MNTCSGPTPSESSWELDLAQFFTEPNPPRLRLSPVPPPLQGCWLAWQASPHLPAIRAVLRGLPETSSSLLRGLQVRTLAHRTGPEGMLGSYSQWEMVGAVVRGGDLYNRLVEAIAGPGPGWRERARRMQKECTLQVRDLEGNPLPVT